ncbi:MAG: Glucokinase [Amycolatopsis sp.]|uniref:ROK family protein n=1 Tax=Amycolatopsis sp. TaxID=37632 RepID=UPI00261F59E4|nr:ROK family protein [Amycolatopsis sp.]MCU1684726.1 Glucokinase [Amycolatopsis sp.]
MSGLWAGVDIGASKTLVVLCDDGGVEVADAAVPTDAAHSGGESILDTAAQLIAQLVAGAELSGVGVGAAGVIDDIAGLVVATGDSFTGWAGTAINAGLSARLGGVPVRADNDVNALLLGELSESGDVRQALGITLGTGVGGALLVDGRLLHGEGNTAGEIGHIGRFGDAPCTCGQRGHLEAYASGRSLSRRYTEATGRNLSAADVAAAASAGDVDAAAVYEEAGRYLGVTIAQTGGLLGLGLAILGGSVTRSWPLLEKSVQRALDEQPLLSGNPVTVRLSRLGAKAVALGAIELVRPRLVRPRSG